MSELEVRFIRHASASHMLRPDLIAGRSLDATLTEEGEREASQKGSELAKESTIPDAVISSPARRCIQTSKLILGAMGITGEIQLADDLLEMDQGDFVGRPRREVYNEDTQQQILALGKNFALPGGESMNQVGRRGFNWLVGLQSLLSGSQYNQHTVLTSRRYNII